MPAFYRDYGVPDTVNGRFDLIVVHLAIVMGCLAQNADSRDLGQELFDRFCKDMDHNLREMGIGDLAVPKEMNRIGEAYYGRSQAYAAALAAEREEALAEALSRNVYGHDGAPPPGARRLALYVRRAVAALSEVDRVALADGAVRFPDPATVPVEA